MPLGPLPTGFHYEYDLYGNPTIVSDTTGEAQRTTSTFDPTSWGGQGDDMLPNGSRVKGTNGASKDVDRYREMAHQTGTAPVIGRDQSDEARGYSMDAIGLLTQQADGTAPSAAMQLGQRTTQNAQNNMQSLANSTRGGAMARAAAARAAQMNQASLAATGRQQQLATQAGEMATARGALLDATTKQRGLDSALATEQAKLDAQQRQQDAQHEQYYERLGWETQNAQAGAKLGRTAAEQAAANAAKASQLAEDQQSWNNTKDVASAGTAAIQGGLAAYNSTSSSDPTKDPNKTGSDERMKDEIVPLMDHPDGRMLQMGPDGRAYYASLEEQDDGRPSLAGPTPMFGRRSQPAESSERMPAPKPAAKAKAAPKMPKKSLEDQIAELQAQMNADHSARMAQGPAVNPYALSDEKTKNSAGSAAMEEANRSLAPSMYEYKPGFTPATQEPGEKNVGPMANNMAKSAIARTAIVQDPETGLLAINKEKGLKLALGGIASLQSQVDALKRKKAS